MTSLFFCTTILFVSLLSCCSLPSSLEAVKDLGLWCLPFVLEKLDETSSRIFQWKGTMSDMPIPPTTGSENYKTWTSRMEDRNKIWRQNCYKNTHPGTRVNKKYEICTTGKIPRTKWWGVLPKLVKTRKSPKLIWKKTTGNKLQNKHTYYIGTKIKHLTIHHCKTKRSSNIY